MQKVRDARKKPSKIPAAGERTVKARMKSILQVCYIQRAGNVLQRKGWRDWRTCGTKEGRGTKEGKEQIHK